MSKFVLGMLLKLIFDVLDPNFRLIFPKSIFGGGDALADCRAPSSSLLLVAVSKLSES